MQEQLHLCFSFLATVSMCCLLNDLGLTLSYHWTQCVNALARGGACSARHAAACAGNTQYKKNHAVMAKDGIHRGDLQCLYTIPMHLETKALLRCWSGGTGGTGTRQN